MVEVVLLYVMTALLYKWVHVLGGTSMSMWMFGNYPARVGRKDYHTWWGEINRVFIESWRLVDMIKRHHTAPWCFSNKPNLASKKRQLLKGIWRAWIQKHAKGIAINPQGIGWIIKRLIWIWQNQCSNHNVVCSYYYPKGHTPITLWIEHYPMHIGRIIVGFCKE